MSGARALAAAVAGSALLLGGLVLLLPDGALAGLWRDADRGWIAAAFALTAAAYLAAAWRLAAMLPGRALPVLRDGLSLNLAHGAAMLLLPAKLGEVVFAGLLHRNLGLSPGGAGALVLTQRLCDLTVVGLLFALSLALTPLDGTAAGVLATAGIAAAAAGAVAAARLAPLSARAARLLAPRRRSRPARVLLRLALQARRAAASGGYGRPLPLALTLLYWLLEVAALHAALRAFGAAPDLGSSLFLGAGLALVFALPLQTVGGLGLGEGGLAALLALDGYPVEAALGLGLSARLLLLALPLALCALLLPLLWPWHARAAARSRGGVRT